MDMSFAFTTEQIKNGTKNVTRRLGWKNLKPEQRLRAVHKCMGLKKGEKRQVLRHIEVVSVKREPLNDFYCDPTEVRREGFPNMTPQEFIAMFCRGNKCAPGVMVTRIEFRYVEGD